MRRCFMLFTLLSTLIVSTQALAHNVVGGVYAIGATIEGEAGFSNGAMASAGTVVHITDSSGNTLGEVQTDEQGFFTFTAEQHITHIFNINMGAGHQLTMQLPAEELPEGLGEKLNGQQTQLQSHSVVANEADLSASTSTLMLEKAIAKQMMPLRKEIKALKEKSGLRDIIGGIGYIFGLLGLLALLRERKMKAKK